MTDAPRMVILYGQEAYERVGRLLNSMVNHPGDLTPIGRAIVDLMPDAFSMSPADLADALAPTLRHYVLDESHVDPYFDQKILIEAINYGARAFKRAWDQQVPAGLDCRHYAFKQFLHGDLCLQRR